MKLIRMSRKVVQLVVVVILEVTAITLNCKPLIENFFPSQQNIYFMSVYGRQLPVSVVPISIAQVVV